jgi:uncharacterized membrane protein
MEEIREKNDARLLAALGYIPPLGLVFFFMERENRFLRFHGLQSALLMIFWAVFLILFLVLGGVVIWTKFPAWGYVYYIASAVIYLTLVIISFICANRAYKGRYFRLPLIGSIALHAAK